MSKERKKDGKLQAIYEKSIALRNIFFDGVEDTISQYIDKNKLKFKIKRSSFYIQFYEKEWENDGIHFEIIIPCNKGLLFQDAKIFIMLHKEKERNTKTKKAELREAFNFKASDSKFNKPCNVLCETSCTIREILSESSGIKSKINTMLSEFNIEGKAEKIDEKLNFKI